MQALLNHPWPGNIRELDHAVERGVLALPGSYFGPGQHTHLRMAFGNLAAERIEILGERLRGFAI